MNLKCLICNKIGHTGISQDCPIRKLRRDRQATATTTTTTQNNIKGNPHRAITFVPAPLPTTNCWNKNQPHQDAAPLSRKQQPTHTNMQKINTQQIDAPEATSVNNNVRDREVRVISVSVIDRGVDKTNHISDSELFSPEELLGIFKKMINIMKNCRTKDQQLTELMRLTMDYL